MGAISSAGLYTFSLVMGDGQGYRSQSYYTLNIQPKDITNSTGIKALTLVDVPVITSQLDVDINALQLTLSAAATTVRNAVQKAIIAQNNVTMARNALYSTANDLVIAQQNSLSFAQAYTDTLQNLNSLQTYINDGASAIASYSIRVSLAKASLTQFDSSLATAQSAYSTAMETFQNCT
jgi:hypothetical protein